MKNILYIAFLFSTTMLGQTITLTDADIRAFPNAQGHGQDATGGRGESVYFVTNTNNTGAGSFRQAISDAISAGGGNIIFRVGGTVTLASDISITGDNISIWGQTAPGDGFAIYNDETVVYGENFVMRHLRFRGGDNISGANPHEDTFRIMDSFQTSTGTPAGTHSNYMIDHCSFSWGGDEVVAIETGSAGAVTVQKVTFSNCIISEGFNAKNMILFGDNQFDISIIKTLFANTSERSIRANTEGAGRQEFEYINNVVYGYSAAIVVEEELDFDVIGSHFIDGFGSPANGQVRITDDNNNNTNNSSDYYLSDNIRTGGTFTKTNDGNSGTGTAAGARQFSSGYTPLSSSVVKDTVTTYSGARATLSDGLDALDAHMVADVVNGSSGAYVTAESQTTGLPTLSSGTPYTDTDSDGLSDAYETANGGTLTASTRPATAVISNGTTIDQSGVTNYATTGYTHLDIFMADLANDWDHFEVTYPDGLKITRSTRIKIGSGTGKVIIGG